ncbi:hypothetical protein ACEPAI_7506 [Sanghuangporus weigelae]
MTTAATSTAAYPSAVDERHFHHPHLSAAATAVYGSAGVGNSLNGMSGIADAAAANTPTTTTAGGYNAVQVGQESLKGLAPPSYGYSYRDREYATQQQQQQQQQLYPSFSETRSTSPLPHMVRSSSYGGGEYPVENAGTATAYDPAVGHPPASASIVNEGPGTGADLHIQHPSSPYGHVQEATTTTTTTTMTSATAGATSMADPNDRQRRYTHALAASGTTPYLSESFRQSKNDSGIFTDVRSAVDTPVDIVSESGATPGGRQTTTQQQHQQQIQQNVNMNGYGYGYGTGMPKHPSISPATPTHGNVPPPRHSPIVPSSAAPSYKPAAIPISSNTRAVAQQPTYITPPSSPTPIAVNPIYTYTDATPRYGQQQRQQQQQQTYRPTTGYPSPPDGREICVECAMRDQDMADVDVTSAGVWDRESDILYHELCRQEMEEEEERAARTKASSSSSESHQVLVRHKDPNRPRARGNRLTEPHLKLWNSMNPREPQARQQGIELYIKTQVALLEAEALAHARAMQESRLLESKLKDTYDHLRRSTYDVSNGTAMVDENGLRLKASLHGQKRSVSGPTPISLGPIVVDGNHHNRHHQSQSREVTLLENGMIVEQVDVRKEERERRREEKRERSRARKSSRGSGGDRNGEVMSMYSAHSPLPYQTDSGFYTAASNGSGPMLARERDRPMSASQSSTRAMSVLTTPQPLTPPPGSAPGSVRPPNTRVHSQISLVDSQSISSASMSANRRSKFFAFRNWSEAWKSRDSFAPSGVMSLSGSMMDMHLALDRERQAMQTRPTTVDLGSNAPSIRHSQIFPRRASVSVDRDVVPSRGLDRPKKKKGLAKIWGMVRGNKSSKSETQRARDVTPVERSEDDTPLAPPPPLSYLVNRTSRDRSMSNASRRTSVPPGTGGGPSNGALPTPTSIRNTWLEDATVSRGMGGMLPAHTEESHSNANGYGGPESDTTRTAMQGQSVGGEPEMRQRSQDYGSELRGPVIQTPGSPRPISVYSLHKSLPPLPNEAPASQSMPTPIDSPRPVTMFDMNTHSHLSAPNMNEQRNEMLGSPQPYFSRDVRRQSFGGMASRPDLTASGTFPLSSGRGNTRSGMGAAQDPFGYSPYSEMGTMRMSVSGSRSTGRLGLGLAADDTVRCESDKTVGKRRSRFGLSNLIGKMTGGSRTSMNANNNNNSNASEGRLSVAVSPPGPPTSESDQHQDGSPSVTEYGVGNGSSRSRHNGNGYMTPGQGASRMSVASRRAIEELVDQDPKFVAYRYPSVDQNIALLR